MLDVIKLEHLEDESLILLSREGDAEATEVLIQRYKGYVRQKIRVSYFVGADRDDLIQEGMIGLFKAICDYDHTKEATFKTFATLCITRQVSTAFKTATRQKHMVLNNSISLDYPMNTDGDESVTLMDTLKLSDLHNPEQMLINQENLENLKENVKKILSKLEWQVLNYHIEGKDYHQIAELMNKSDKSIDNALQRIKRKIAEIYKKGLL